MRINHRRAQIRMAQQLLHRANIRPCLQQMSRKGMSKRMRSNVLQ